MMERTIPWTDVTKYYPHTLKVNGITTARKLVIETRHGEFNLEGVWFNESPAVIADAIQRAATE